MDLRRAAFEKIALDSFKEQHAIREHYSASEEIKRRAQIMADGQQSEFWPHVTEQINGLIRHAEARFLDSLAADYQTYVQWFSRRQALIQILTLPDRVIAEARIEKEG